jgi:hypothetical protein
MDPLYEKNSPGSQGAGLWVDLYEGVEFVMTWVCPMGLPL